MHPDIRPGDTWTERDGKARLELTIVVTSVQGDEVHVEKSIGGRAQGRAIFPRSNFGPRGDWKLFDRGRR